MDEEYCFKGKKFAFATLVSSDDECIEMARVLLYSYKKVMKLKVDFIAVVIKGNKLSKINKCFLEQVGWQIVEVDGIQFLKDPLLNNWKDTFTKIQLAKMVEYDKIVFLDSDCIVTQNIDELFHLPTDYAAVIDYNSMVTGYPPLYTNSGVFVIKPSLCLYFTLLINMKRVSEYENRQQSYVNWLMEYKMWRLSLFYNARHSIFLRNVTFWNKELKQSHKIIQFTVPKPFSGETSEILTLWSSFQNETN